jgi:Ca2+-binding EF-hand superfamily protein
MRIFDSDGNGFLDFKEFLMAINVATCQTEESKLVWVFKLYDVDNDGVLDIDELASIMETLESLEFTSSQKSKKRKLTILQISYYY